MKQHAVANEAHPSPSEETEQLGVRKIGLLWVGVACNRRGVCGVSMSLLSREAALEGLNRRTAPARDAAGSRNEGRLMADAFEQLREYFAGCRKAFDLPLDLTSGTDFQREVWRACIKVPYGQTRAYSWIAERIGRLNAARAVGGALGANPVPIIVPCHRILRADGSLGGYSGGLEIKPLLLKLESRGR